MERSVQFDLGPTPSASPRPRGVLGRLLRQGWRSACLRRPSLDDLNAGPASLLVLLFAEALISVALERWMIDGPATFYAPAMHSGWLGTVVAVGLCWLVARNASHTVTVAMAPALFGVVIAQGIVIYLTSGSLLLAQARTEWLDAEGVSAWLPWLVWLLPGVWSWLAQLVLLLRFLRKSWTLRFALALGLSLPYALDLWWQPPQWWYPVATDARADKPPRVHLTQEVMERQAQLLPLALDAIGPQRPGVIDVYAITFAPYADEDVFRREGDLVASVMRERFDADTRTLQLANHRDTAVELPWATPLNLQRAIARLGAVMNVDEDMLFIHLTSHGAADGKLAARLRPLDLGIVTPAALKHWLDEAGIRYRVISVSACYSGSWVAPLAGEATLVMTASDAQHTSYGCGRHSELTYFGRAIYDEQLRRTYSFEQAHAAARSIIEQRERDAGKSDGYSNPQIAVGAAIRAQLARLEVELSARGQR